MQPYQVRYISSGLVLLGLGGLFMTGQWWPGLLIVIAISGIVKNFLLKRWLKLLFHGLLLGIIYALEYWDFFQQGLIPGILFCCGSYLILKAFFANTRPQILRD